MEVSEVSSSAAGSPRESLIYDDDNSDRPDGEAEAKPIDLHNLPPLLVSEQEAVAAEYQAFGGIDEPRLGELLQRLQIVADDEPEVHAMFALITHSRQSDSKYLSLDETLDLVRACKAVFIQQAEVTDNDEVSSFAAIGGREDRSGYIEQVKLKALCQGFGLGIDIDRFMAEVDTDGSGCVEYDEFLQLLNAEELRMNVEQLLENFGADELESGMAIPAAELLSLLPFIPSELISDWTETTVVDVNSFGGVLKRWGKEPQEVYDMWREYEAEQQRIQLEVLAKQRRDTRAAEDLMKRQQQLTLSQSRFVREKLAGTRMQRQLDMIMEKHDEKHNVHRKHSPMRQKGSLHQMLTRRYSMSPSSRGGQRKKTCDACVELKDRRASPSDARMRRDSPSSPPYPYHYSTRNPVESPRRPQSSTPRQQHSRVSPASSSPLPSQYRPRPPPAQTPAFSRPTSAKSRGASRPQSARSRPPSVLAFGPPVPAVDTHAGYSPQSNIHPIRMQQGVSSRDPALVSETPGSADWHGSPDDEEVERIDLESPAPQAASAVNRSGPFVIFNELPRVQDDEEVVEKPFSRLQDALARHRKSIAAISNISAMQNMVSRKVQIVSFIQRIGRGFMDREVMWDASLKRQCTREHLEAILSSSSRSHGLISMYAMDSKERGGSAPRHLQEMIANVFQRVFRGGMARICLKEYCSYAAAVQDFDDLLLQDDRFRAINANKDVYHGYKRRRWLEPAHREEGESSRMSEPEGSFMSGSSTEGSLRFQIRKRLFSVVSRDEAPRKSLMFSIDSNPAGRRSLFVNSVSGSDSKRPSMMASFAPEENSTLIPGLAPAAHYTRPSLPFLPHSPGSEGEDQTDSALQSRRGTNLESSLIRGNRAKRGTKRPSNSNRKKSSVMDMSLLSVDASLRSSPRGSVAATGGGRRRSSIGGGRGKGKRKSRAGSTFSVTVKDPDSTESLHTSQSDSRPQTPHDVPLPPQGGSSLNPRGLSLSIPQAEEPRLSEQHAPHDEKDELGLMSRSDEALAYHRVAPPSGVRSIANSSDGVQPSSPPVAEQPETAPEDAPAPLHAEQTLELTVGQSIALKDSPAMVLPEPPADSKIANASAAEESPVILDDLISASDSREASPGEQQQVRTTTVSVENAEKAPTSEAESDLEPGPSLTLPIPLVTVQHPDDEDSTDSSRDRTMPPIRSTMVFATRRPAKPVASEVEELPDLPERAAQEVTREPTADRNGAAVKLQKWARGNAGRRERSRRQEMAEDHRRQQETEEALQQKTDERGAAVLSIQCWARMIRGKREMHHRRDSVEKRRSQDAEQERTAAESVDPAPVGLMVFATRRPAKPIPEFVAPREQHDVSPPPHRPQHASPRALLPEVRPAPTSEAAAETSSKSATWTGSSDAMPSQEDAFGDDRRIGSSQLSSASELPPGGARGQAHGDGPHASMSTAGHTVAANRHSRSRSASMHSQELNRSTSLSARPSGRRTSLSMSSFVSQDGMQNPFFESSQRQPSVNTRRLSNTSASFLSTFTVPTEGSGSISSTGTTMTASTHSSRTQRTAGSLQGYAGNSNRASALPSINSSLRSTNTGASSMLSPRVAASLVAMPGSGAQNTPLTQDDLPSSVLTNSMSSGSVQRVPPGVLTAANSAVAYGDQPIVEVEAPSQSGSVREARGSLETLVVGPTNPAVNDHEKKLDNSALVAALASHANDSLPADEVLNPRSEEEQAALLAQTLVLQRVCRAFMERRDQGELYFALRDALEELDVIDETDRQVRLCQKMVRGYLGRKRCQVAREQVDMLDVYRFFEEGASVDGVM